MSRLPALAPEELDEEQRAVYEAIVHGRRATGAQHFLLRHHDGSLTGPFNALLHAPGVGARVSGLGEAIRFETTLAAREREIAILTVAVARRASFEWSAHERVGRACGLSDSDLRALRAREVPAFGNEREILAHAVADKLAAAGPLDDATYERARSAFGERGLVELVALVGYYVMLATMLQAFAVGVSEGDDPFDGAGAA